MQKIQPLPSLGLLTSSADDILTSAESARADLLPDGEVLVGNVPLAQRHRRLPTAVPRVGRRRSVAVHRRRRVLTVQPVRRPRRAG